MRQRLEGRTVDVCHVLTFVSSTGSNGGPYSVALQQYRARTAAGLSCTICAGVVDGYDSGVDPVVRQVPVRSYSRRLRVSLLFGLRVPGALWAAIGESRSVHISYARDLLPMFAAIIALLRRRRLILQPHGMLTVGRQSWAKRIFDKLFIGWVLRRADVLVALTGRERATLERRYGVSGDRIAIIGNGVDLDRAPFAAAAARQLPPHPEVLFVARLHPRKRVQDFIDAHALSRVPARWVVAGPPDGDEAIVEAAAARGEIIYEGMIPPDEVEFRVAAASVFVLPSLNEPWGNLLVAALALGIPVVVAESADLAPLIAAAGAGRVVGERDPQQIAAAVDEIVRDGPAYTAMSAAALRLAKHEFSQSAFDARIVATSSGGPGC